MFTATKQFIIICTKIAKGLVVIWFLTTWHSKNWKWHFCCCCYSTKKKTSWRVPLVAQPFKNEEKSRSESWNVLVIYMGELHRSHFKQWILQSFFLHLLLFQMARGASATIVVVGAMLKYVINYILAYVLY